MSRRLCRRRKEAEKLLIHVHLIPAMPFANKVKFCKIHDELTNEEKSEESAKLNRADTIVTYNGYFNLTRASSPC
jgi:hypothetical protein